MVGMIWLAVVLGAACGRTDLDGAGQASYPHPRQPSLSPSSEH